MLSKIRTSVIAMLQQQRGRAWLKSHVSSPLPVTTKCGPSTHGLNIRGKHIQSIVIIKQYPDLPASPTSIRRTKNCRVSPWNSTAIRLSRLLEPSGSQLKSSGRSLVSSGG